MTDPQTAADAAERVQRWLDAVREHGRRDTGYPDEDDVQALLAERARMAAELEQVREERAAAQPQIVAELMRLTPEQLSARRCAWCSPNPTMAGLWCLCIAACGNTNCKHDEAEPTVTRPVDGRTGAAQGPTLPTAAQGPQRGSQGDAVDGGG